jgi:hypothetical protein
VPRITGTQLPPIDMASTSPSRFSAVASSRLGATHIDALRNHQGQFEITLRAQTREQAGKSGVGASCRWILGDAEKRREHAHVQLGIVALFTHVKQNADRQIGLDAPRKDFGTRPRGG